MDAGEDQTLTCNTTSLTLSASSTTVGDLSYEWTSPDGNIVSGSDTPTPSIDAAGTYNLTITNNTNGCSATDAVVVSLNNTAPDTNAGADAVLTCALTELVLNGSSSSTATLSYSWSTTDGNIVSGADTATPSVNAAGTYTLTITDDANGCSNTDEVLITADADLPDVDAGEDVELTCLLTAVDLTAMSTTLGDVSFEWTTLDGVIPGDPTSPFISVSTPGNYVITITDNETACSNSDNVTVTENTIAPDLSAGADMELDCTSLEATLDASTSATSTDLSISWSTTDGAILSGGDSFTPIVNLAGTYTITLTDNTNGCSTSDELVVTDCIVSCVNPPAPLLLNSDLVFCTGELNTTSFEATTIAGTIVNWYDAEVGGNLLGTGETFLATEAGTYWAEAVQADDPDCFSERAAFIISEDAVNLSVEATPGTITLGESVILNASASASLGLTLNYDWTATPTDESLTNGESTANVSPLNSTSYTLIVSDEFGCTATATTDVEVIVPTENVLLFPNVFSPNYDGVNDHFRPEGANIASYDLHIRNRWGQEVYRSQNAASSALGWDGSFKGKVQELGVYVYYCTVTYTDGTQEQQKGNVILKR